MNNMIPDANVRQQALDPSRSFIVQAPAGSGKTELLIQRFLRLLACVEQQPEEVLAITFTRKAAAEMQQRVMQALQLAQQPEPPKAAHQQQTWQLAQAVLQRDAEEGWQLLLQPQRLHITTIDAFCAQCCQAMPILGRLGAQPKVVEDALPLYQEAAARLLADIEDPKADWQPDLAKVVRHLDNRLEQIESLFITMLARRDQWLDLVVAQQQHEDLFTHVANNLQEVMQGVLQQVQQQLPQALRDELQTLMHHAMQHSDVVLPTEWDAPASVWQNLANWLLTQSGELRKVVDRRQGFIAKQADMSADEKQFVAERKAQMLRCLHALSAQPEWLMALRTVQIMPVAGYEQQHGAMLQALLACLPVAVGYLRVVFSEQQQMDFTEVSLTALHALGACDSPSDLALRLDYQIRHILVDEFQDTSDSQYRLLHLLTQAWQADDGRTLFLVGDPMQSIYRFRQAEVGLFLQTAQGNLGHVPLTFLQLQANFRCEPGLVQWFNQVCPQIFPSVGDPLRGAVPYHPAVAMRADESSVEWCWHDAEAPEQEAQSVVQAIEQQLQRQPDSHIAVLVRSRRHLEDILPALRHAEMSYQAVELAALSDRMVVQDLLSLTYALSHVGDRLSWLSVIRAPWCGLSLADLHHIAMAAKGQTVWSVLPIVAISKDGQARVQQLLTALTPFMQLHSSLSLRQRVEQAWWALQGPGCLREAMDIEAAEQFFALLSEYAPYDRLLDRLPLEQALAKARLNQQQSDTQVEVMTIHKAKGLEFDCVILPGLDRGARADISPLLLWQEYPCAQGLPKLLMAPIKPYGVKEDAVYQFLYRIEQEKAQYELQRLLYVALTRAKSRLVLCAGVRQDAKGQYRAPSRQSLLHLLWPVAKAEMTSLQAAFTILAN